MRILDSAALTDVGRRRPHNEDCILHLQGIPLFAVADGVGGEAAGEVASSVAMDVLNADAKLLQIQASAIDKDNSRANRFRLTQLLESTFRRAHQEVHREAGHLERAGMATTLVTVVIAGDAAYIAHVGDSRAYLLRGGRLRRLTDDHSLAMLRYRQGLMALEDVATARDRNTLYQALGVGARLDVDTAKVALADGDVVMLCSDGLTDLVDEKHIASVLARGRLDVATQRLVDLANEAGGRDNISVVAFRVGSEQSAEALDEIAQVLSRVFLFKDLSETERMLIAPFMEQRTLQTGAVLFREGDNAEEFYVVLEGEMRISRGKTRLTDVGPGGVFGEMALARPIRRSATLRALCPTVLYQLSREDFHRILKHKPDLAARLCLAFVDVVGQRLRDLTDRLAMIERVASGESWVPVEAPPTFTPD
jgi:serine/threonine protein phosphatase PrpC